MRLSNAQTDTIGETLAERTGGDFNTVSVSGFWVTGGQRVDLTEGLQVIHGELVTQEVEEDVLESATSSELSMRVEAEHGLTYACLRG